MFTALLIIAAIAFIFIYLTSESMKEGFSSCKVTEYNVTQNNGNYNVKIALPQENIEETFNSEEELKEYFSGLLTNEKFVGCETRINEIINDVKSVVKNIVSVDENVLMRLMNRVEAIEGFIIENKEDKTSLSDTNAIKKDIENKTTSAVKQSAELALIDIEIIKQDQLKATRELFERQNLDVLAKLNKSKQEIENRKNKIIELKNSIAIAESELEKAKNNTAYVKNRSYEESNYVLSQYVTALTRRVIELGLEVTQYKLNKCEICPLFTSNNPVSLADIEKLGLGLGSIVTDGRV